MALRLLASGWRKGLAAGAIVGLAAVSSHAQAQTMFDFFSPDVSPREVAAGIVRHGFVMRSALVRRGDVYVVDVTDPSGAMERLIIDAHSGRLAQRYASRTDPYRADPQRYAPAPRAYDEDGMYEPATRPDPDLEPPRPPSFSNSESDAELRAARQRQLAYGADGRALDLTPVGQDAKPAEKPKPKVARPKPSASPSVDATTTDPLSAGKDAALAPSPGYPKSAVAPEPLKTATAPAKKEGVVASSGQAATQPVVIAPSPVYRSPVVSPEPAKAVSTPAKKEGVVASSGQAATQPAAIAPALASPSAVASPEPSKAVSAPPKKEGVVASSGQAATHAAIAPAPASPSAVASPEPSKAASAPAKKEGVVASSGQVAPSAPVPAAPAPVSTAPAAKNKAINDIPVTPLD